MRRLGASCSKPSYGRVLGSDIVGSLVTAAITAAGAGAGYLLAKSAGARPGVGAFGGGAAGLLVSIYPSLLSRRAVLRTSSCTDPGLGSILLYMLAGSAIRAGATGVGSLTGEPVLQGLTGLGGFLAAPLAGQSIVKS